MLGLECEPRAQAVVSLDLEGLSFGVAGIGRSQTGFRFEARELVFLENIARVIAAGASTQLGVDDLECEVAVIRALGPGLGTEIVVDREAKRVLWTSDPHSVACGLESHEEHILVESIEQRLALHASDEMPPTPARMPIGLVVAAAALDEEALFPGRCAAARIQSFGDRIDPLEGLSSRERTVARFLVNGYAAPNIAAITGLAEHTVRTYVRRLYKKLDVCNRADLIRKVLGRPTDP
jgi:DNA-binding CsgD family transcriptional regulator